MRSESSPTPEEIAAAFVTLPPEEPAGGQHHFQLVSPNGESIRMGPFANPALTREKFEAVQAFVAAVIREATSEAAGRCGSSITLRGS